MWNADPSNQHRQTTVGDFWSEWVQDYYPWVITHATTWAQNTITTMRNNCGPSTDDRSKIILEILASLEAQLTGLTIDTSRMN
jgi:hypothetical protein